MQRSGIFENKHVWLTDEFSVPSEQLCLDAAPSPDADCFCLRGAGHKGAHEYTHSPTRKNWSWKDRCINHDDRAVREYLDGDLLCQECCNNWVRSEGVAAKERELEND